MRTNRICESVSSKPKLSPIVFWTTSIAMSAAAMPVASARNPPTRASSGRSRNTPRLPQKPAIRPMTAATGAKNAAFGPAPPGIGRIDQMRFDSRPVSAPAQGPASDADEHGPDRVEVDRQAQREGDRADRDVDRDRDRHQAQRRRREVARPSAGDEQQDCPDDQGDEVCRLDRLDAALRLIRRADRQPVEHGSSIPRMRPEPGRDPSAPSVPRSHGPPPALRRVR